MDVALLNVDLKSSPTSRLQILKLIEGGAGADKLEHGRLSGYLALTSAFGEHSLMISQLLDLESRGARFKGMELMLSRSDSESMRNLLTRMVDENVWPQNFTKDYLYTRRELENRYGIDSPTMKLLLQRFPRGEDLTEFGRFVDNTGERGKALISEIIENGADPELLDPTRLWHVLKVMDVSSKAGSSVMPRLYELEKQGLSFHVLYRFLLKNPTRIAVIEDALNRDFPPEKFSIQNLFDRTYLQDLDEHFPPSSLEAEKIDSLQQHGLSASRLSHYIAELPESVHPPLSSYSKRTLT